MEEMPYRPTVLFLIADTGTGHRSAASAIRQAMHTLAVESGQRPYHTDSIDAFAACGKFPLQKISQLYGGAIAHVPWLYGNLFHLTNRPWSFRVLERLIYWLMHRGLAQVLRKIEPDIIVCVHPLLNHVTLRVLAESHLQVPFLTVMTDLVTPHLGWVASPIVHCIVPTEVTRGFCQQHGMRDEIIQVLGMPIDLKFSQACDQKIALREKLGLSSTMPTVLLVGSAADAGKFIQAVRAIWQAALPVQLLIVTGRNQRLQQWLRSIAQQLPGSLQNRCQILGFVENMHELMGAADVLVTKAGPSTICEAVACKLPILLSGFVPGQEEGNVPYVCHHGIGLLAETPEKLISTLEECFSSNSALLEQMRANMAHLQNPLAALAIAECILSTMPLKSTPVGRIVVAQSRLADRGNYEGSVTCS